ncbi:hypothetical protein [Roseivivax lentus]|nr:hypothetical protein [Roseivivax lentus]
MRKVAPLPAYHDAVLDEFRALSRPCVAGAEFLLEELESADPDPDERCGLLEDRYEIYTLAIPGCRGTALALALDTARRPPWPCLLLGLMSRRGDLCEAARRRATQHLSLIDPSWEPAHGKD